jgi:hypothetical protein
VHRLLDAAVLAVIERSASEHRGRRWVSRGFTDQGDRASHPCGILHGAPFSVFAKFSVAADAREQFTAELAGLRLLSRAAGVPVPVPALSGPEPRPAQLHGDAAWRPKSFVGPRPSRPRDPQVDHPGSTVAVSR